MGRLLRSILALLIAYSGISLAQSIETLVDRYSGPNAKGYVQPLASAIGAGLNSGLLRNAHVPESGFHFEIRLNAMAALFSEEQRFFTASTEGVFPLEEEIQTSTIIGPGQGGVLEAPNGARYVLPGGYDLGSLPLIVPTLSIGSVGGTEAQVRFFRSNAVEDVGTISLVGGGIRHSFSQYIPSAGFDLAAGAAFTSFDVGDNLQSEAFTIHAEIGKAFPWIELYGGVGYETSSVDVNYTIEDGDDSVDINLSLEGENQFRILAGFSLNLTIVHLAVDFNVGKQNVLNVGLGIGQ